MVRNESDVAEAFVRHNLALLDALWIVDHRSDDGTSAILAALVAEGLQLQVEAYAGMAQHQAEIVTALARRAFASGAECVIPLDADEFLKIPSRWQTYVPRAATLVPGAPLATHRRGVEAHGLHKVVLTGAFARNPDAIVGPGNHSVLMRGAAQNLADDPIRLALLPPDIAALAHLPVRSAEQLVRKITVGWQAHVAAARSDRNLAFHWRELYEELARAGMPTPERLQQIAVNYGVPMHAWQAPHDVALVPDPLPAVPAMRYASLRRSPAVQLPPTPRSGNAT